MTHTKAARDPLSSAPRARRTAFAVKTAAIFAIVIGILLAIVGARIMSDAASDVSHMLASAPPDGLPWILLIGILVLGLGVVSLWPAFRRHPE